MKPFDKISARILFLAVRQEKGEEGTNQIYLYGYAHLQKE